MERRRSLHLRDSVNPWVSIFAIGLMIVVFFYILITGHRALNNATQLLLESHQQL